MNGFLELQAKFITDFIEDQRYLYIIDGLKTTSWSLLWLSSFGLVLGAVVAIIRTTYSQLKRKNEKVLVDFC